MFIRHLKLNRIGAVEKTLSLLNKAGVNKNKVLIDPISIDILDIVKEKAVVGLSIKQSLLSKEYIVKKLCFDNAHKILI